MLDEPALTEAVELGLAQIAQTRALKQAWRAMLTRLRETHGNAAVRAVEEEIEYLQREQDMEVLRRR